MLQRLAVCQCNVGRRGVQNIHSSSKRLASVVNPYSFQYQRLSSTPNWSQESLAAVKDKYEQKYKELLEKKAAEQGFESVEELKATKLHESKLKERAKDVLSRPTAPKKPSPEVAAETPSASTASPSPASKASSSKSPIKPLSAIVDLPKLLPQSPDAIGQIWNGYHQMQDNTLSAAIPYDIYRKMAELGKAYSQFVVPLPREVVDEQGDKKMGAEMQFLQWAFLPQEAENPNVPPPSTVLFTPLALFKSQSTFAQPHLILTHYTDLVPTHNLVLMRGDLTEDCSTKLPDAQLLVLRLQQFYQGSHEKRAELLKTFHETPEKFDVDELVASVGEV